MGQYNSTAATRHAIGSPIASASTQQSPVSTTRHYTMASFVTLGRSTSLPDLPPGLRDYIYALALVKDEPIIAYISEKAIYRSGNLRNGRIRHKVFTYPTLPGISLTCRQTHQEASAIFYSKNKFRFSEESDGFKGLRVWHRCMQSRYEDPMTRNLRHMVVEFMAISSHARKGLQYGEMEASLSIDGKITVGFGGLLETICMCRLLEHLNRYNEQDPESSTGSHNRLLRYISRSQELRYKHSFPKKKVTLCTGCGKERRVRPTAA